jgi:hypothetical protein
MRILYICVVIMASPLVATAQDVRLRVSPDILIPLADTDTVGHIYRLVFQWPGYHHDRQRVLANRDGTAAKPGTF